MSRNIRISESPKLYSNSPATSTATTSANAAGATHPAPNAPRREPGLETRKKGRCSKSAKYSGPGTSWTSPADVMIWNGTKIR